MEISYKSNIEGIQKAMSEAEKQALYEIGFFVEAESKLRCPVETGALKRSITNVVDEEEKSITVGTNNEYAPYVELGTSNQKAKPYLYSSIQDNIEQIKTIFEKYLRKEVE